MQFAQIEMLHLFWALIALIVFLIWSNKYRNRILNAFADNAVLNKIVKTVQVKTKTRKDVLLVLVILFSILALARPQWGFEWQEVKREGLDILVVIDTSKSMLTQDVKPNRLERTKLAVKDLIKKLKGDRIGLIAFSGDAFLVCPLTVDYNGFLLSLNEITTGYVPRGGTNIEKAIDVALKGYGDIANKHKAIIVVTDGDNLEGAPLKIAKKAKQEGVKIYTIGIGTPEGELIQIPGETNQFLKDAKGNFVKSRLNESLLKEIALATDGIYVRAGGVQFGLDFIYEQELSKLETREVESKMDKRYFERFQWPLVIAFILLCIESCLNTRKEN